MTFYFRPYSIEPSTTQGPPGTVQEIDLPKKIKVIFLEQLEDKERELSTHIIQMNSFIKDGVEYTAVPAKTKLIVRIENCEGKRQKIGESEIIIKDVLINFEGTKDEEFENRVWFQEYTLTYLYKYNRYLSICGGSVFKQWSLQQPNHQDKRLQLSQEGDQKLPVINRQLITKRNNPNNSQIQPNYPSESLSQERTFYKGACQHVNLFSMLDPRNEPSSQFSIMENTYK